LQLCAGVHKSISDKFTGLSLDGRRLYMLIRSAIVICGNSTLHQLTEMSSNYRVERKTLTNMLKCHRRCDAATLSQPEL